MSHISSIHFDIAAIVVMLVTLASLILRGMTRGATNRVYLTAMILVTITAITSLIGELYDAFIMPNLVQSGVFDQNQPPESRDVIALTYLALTTLIAPTYLVLIAAVSDTTHRLDRNNLVRFCLWTPMIAAFVEAFSNPMHHMVYSYVEGVPQPGPLMVVLYASTVYYSLVGVAWLIKWRGVLSTAEFCTMLALYPLLFGSFIVQYAFPDNGMEMFMVSIAMLLLSAFVIRPEKRLDSLVNAASISAYQEMCRRAFLTEKKLCLVYLEIVNFEKLRELIGNDELHDLVRQMSSTLASTLSPSDTLYYLRDGLFCISPHNTDPQRALQIAQQTHEEGKARSMAKRERSTNTQMRTCIVRVPEDASDVETLKTFIRRFAHLVPQSCVTTYAELSKRENFELEMALADILDNAIEDQSFTVHYQPIWSMKEQRFLSAEALARLNDPTYGWVSPALFIPEAEQNGSIIEIGDIMLEKICSFMSRADLEDLGIDHIAANLSTDQCVRPQLAGEILALLDKFGVEPQRMHLEITESSSSYSQVISENVTTLSEAGLSFSLDDYGTGYSSVSRSLSLPFSTVKLDKCFADGVDDPSMHIVVTDTVEMMRSIGKQTLIEGVETQEQVEAFEAMGLDFIQGYFFAKPMPEDEFVDFLLAANGAR